jgi:uncharacterized membrane protein
MTGPDNEIAVGAQDHGRLRASRADREQVVDVLKAAFTQGRLDHDEFDQRIGRALTSRTYADLAVLTADIPIQSAGMALPVARTSVNSRAVAALTGATAALVAVCPVTAHTPDGSPFAVPVLVIFLVLMMVVPTGWLVLLHDWMERRSARKATASEIPIWSASRSRGHRG